MLISLLVHWIGAPAAEDTEVNSNQQSYTQQNFNTSEW